MTLINQIKALSLSILFLFAASVGAADYPPTKTFEAQMSSIRMPASLNGTVTLRECDSCPFETVRVTPNTRFEIDGKSYKFEDFLEALKELRGNGADGLNVTRDETSQTASVIFLYTD